MRNLQKDLEICQKITSGKWNIVAGFRNNIGFMPYAVFTENESGEHIAVDMYKCDAKFLVTAREGFEEAINRAIAAETEVERLKEKNKKLTEIAKNYLNHMRSTPLNDAKFRFIDYIEEVLEGCK